MHDDYLEALDALHAAECHFDYAEPEYVEAAILELDAAQRRVNAILRREKVREVQTA